MAELMEIEKRLFGLAESTFSIMEYYEDTFVAMGKETTTAFVANCKKPIQPYYPTLHLFSPKNSYTSLAQKIPPYVLNPTTTYYFLHALAMEQSPTTPLFSLKKTPAFSYSTLLLLRPPLDQSPVFGHGTNSHLTYSTLLLPTTTTSTTS